LTVYNFYFLTTKTIYKMEIKLNVVLDATPQLLSALTAIATAIAGAAPQTSAEAEAPKKKPKETKLVELPPANEPAPQVAPQVQSVIEQQPAPQVQSVIEQQPAPAAPKAGGMNGVATPETMRKTAMDRVSAIVESESSLDKADRVKSMAVKAILNEMGVKGVSALPDDKVGLFLSLTTEYA